MFCLFECILSTIPGFSSTSNNRRYDLFLEWALALLSFLSSYFMMVTVLFGYVIVSYSFDQSVVTLYPFVISIFLAHFCSIVHLRSDSVSMIPSMLFCFWDSGSYNWS